MALLRRQFFDRGEARFREHRFYTVKPLEPVRVADPLFWLFRDTGLIDV